VVVVTDAPLRNASRIASEARLRAFELEFEAEHGRKPRKKRDWQPVLADYNRYDALRKAEAEAVAAAGSAK